MKKLLVGSAAIALGLALVSPAQAADGVKLGIGGYFKGYMTWHDQDEAVAGPFDARDIDMLRDTEVHFTGETTLDNGLTVGFHTELADDLGNSFDVDESYAYFSGGWGRVNFGGEDGAAYLLQVAAPSADSNIDGLRQYIDAVNYVIAPAAFTGLGAIQWDYAQDITKATDKITYLSPVFSGFQGGVTYTPDTLDSFSTGASRGLAGVTTDDVEDEFGDAWEVALRYAGQFDGWGLTAGAGYTTANIEDDSDSTSQDRDVWNIGANVNFMAFNLGVSYKDDNDADGDGVDADDDDANTWVVGGDYTTGPFKLGVSYMNRDSDNFSGTDSLETDRYSGGVTYTYGPGMTFRGSVHHISHEVASDDMDATTLLLGTQIDF